MTYDRIWYVTTTDGTRQEFYRSGGITTTAGAMWESTKTMNEDGCVPLLVKKSLVHWKSKQMRGRVYFLVPLTEITLIDFDDFSENQRLFFTDHIRGSANEC